MEEHGGNRYGKDIILDFSVNINPFGMPPSVKKAAVEGIGLSHRYPDLYKQGLTEALAKRYLVSMEQIVTGNGAAELIYAAVAAIRPRSGYIVGPTFSEYANALHAHDCQPIWDMAKRENGYEIDLDVAGRIEQSDCEMVFMCNPNNPTGRLLGGQVLTAILDVCKQKEKWLVIDECFLELTKAEGTSYVNKLNTYKRLLILKAFTKSFAIPGLRLGFLLANEKEAARIKKVLPPWNVSLPAQLAGTAAARELDYVKVCSQELIKERMWMEEELTKAGYRVYPSDTIFILFEGPKDLQQYCLSHQVLIRDAGSFRGIKEGTYRIGIKQRKENERLLEILRKAIGGESWRK